jgi:hypothetical protein
MASLTVTLASGKIVQLSNAMVSGQNQVAFTLKFVGLNIELPYTIDFGSFPDWKKDNPTGTWKEFAKAILLNIYDSYALAQQIKAAFDQEAK